MISIDTIKLSTILQQPNSKSQHLNSQDQDLTNPSFQQDQDIDPFQYFTREAKVLSNANNVFHIREKIEDNIVLEFKTVFGIKYLNLFGSVQKSIYKNNYGDNNEITYNILEDFYSMLFKKYNLPDKGWFLSRIDIGECYHVADPDLEIRQFQESEHHWFHHKCSYPEYVRFYSTRRALAIYHKHFEQKGKNVPHGTIRRELRLLGSNNIKKILKTNTLSEEMFENLYSQYAKCLKGFWCNQDIRSIKVPKSMDEIVILFCEEGRQGLHKVGWQALSKTCKSTYEDRGMRYRAIAKLRQMYNADTELVKVPKSQLSNSKE